MPNFGNLAMQIGMSAARGAFISTATTAAVQGGGNLGPAAAWGGGMGGLSGFIGSQHFTNWTEGYGFKSNQGIIDSLAKQGRYQEAIDFAAHRYDYQSGTWDPDNIQFKTSPGTVAFTDPTSGKIVYGRLAFSERGMLQAAGFHESIHFHQVISESVGWDHIRAPLTGGIRNFYSLEVDACKATIANAGRLNLTPTIIQNHREYLDYNIEKKNLYEGGYDLAG